MEPTENLVGLIFLLFFKFICEKSCPRLDIGRPAGRLGQVDETRQVYPLLHESHAPCILYDLDGYYTGLRMLLSHMIETGLSSEERQKGIYFAKDLAEIKTILNR